MAGERWRLDSPLPSFVRPSLLSTRVDRRRGAVIGRASAWSAAVRRASASPSSSTAPRAYRHRGRGAATSRVTPRACGPPGNAGSRRVAAAVTRWWSVERLWRSLLLSTIPRGTDPGMPPLLSVQVAPTANSAASFPVPHCRPTTGSFGRISWLCGWISRHLAGCPALFLDGSGNVQSGAVQVHPARALCQMNVMAGDRWVMSHIRNVAILN